MTPARRKRLTKSIAIILGLMLVTGIARYVFLEQNILVMLAGRPLHSLDSGTVLIHHLTPNTKFGPSVDPSQIPVEVKKPIKISFNKIGKWKFRDGKSSIPDEVKELDGKWVEITGYMHSINNTQYVSRFLVVQSLLDCCFGKLPAMNQFIDVMLPPGQVALSYGYQVKIIGKLTVGELRENGSLLSLYRLEAHRVEVK
jgi:hypothetical protein